MLNSKSHLVSLTSFALVHVQYCVEAQTCRIFMCAVNRDNWEAYSTYIAVYVFTKHFFTARRETVAHVPQT